MGYDVVIVTIIPNTKRQEMRAGHAAPWPTAAATMLVAISPLLLSVLI
jgi:hypothetical protein